jgi:ribosomal protein S18 acetylase RimI-like enzyme
MSSVSWPTAAKSAADGLEIVPIGRQHIAGFHAALDSVAKERRYLALLEAPSFARTRRFVVDSLKTGAVHVVAVADDKVVGWCDLRPRTAPTMRHSALLGMGVVTAHRGRGIGSRMLAIALYRRFGFVEEGRCRNYLCIDGVDYDALLMARLEPRVDA